MVEDESKNLELWDKVVKSIEEPPNHKKIWNMNDNCKLALVIIEPRKHEWLKGVLYNFAHIYGGRDDTSLYIFHGNENKQFVLDILKGWDMVSMIHMNVSNLSIFDYNKYITSVNFWNNIKAEYALIFQTDTLLRKEIEPVFFKYDYVGSPWYKYYTQKSKLIGNGGLSLRNVKIMKYICSLSKYLDIITINDKVYYSENLMDEHPTNEDVYFSERLLDESIPSVEDAMKFSVESIFYEYPCGMHKTYKFVTTSQLVNLLIDLPGLNTDTNNLLKSMNFLTT